MKNEIVEEYIKFLDFCFLVLQIIFYCLKPFTKLLGNESKVYVTSIWVSDVFFGSRMVEGRARTLQVIPGLHHKFREIKPC